jgi:hypothetical protein
MKSGTPEHCSAYKNVIALITLFQFTVAIRKSICYRLYYSLS